MIGTRRCMRDFRIAEAKQIEGIDSIYLYLHTLQVNFTIAVWGRAHVLSDMFRNALRERLCNIVN